MSFLDAFFLGALRARPLISRMYYECEGGIEKFVPTIIERHCEACRVMTNGDQERQIFLYHPQTNNGVFFLLTVKYCFL